MDNDENNAVRARDNDDNDEQECIVSMVVNTVGTKMGSWNKATDSRSRVWTWLAQLAEKDREIQRLCAADEESMRMLNF